MRASVSWRTCRVVVHSSILALRPSFSTMPSPSESAQPPSARICLALSGSKVVPAAVLVEPRRRADVRVRDRGVAAEEPRVDLVLVDRVGDRLADRRVGGRAARAAVLDRRVARAATGVLVARGRERARRPVRAQELVQEGRDRRDLVAEILDLREVRVLEVEGDVDLVVPEARDHRVRIAVPLEDDFVEVGRLAGAGVRVVVVLGEAELRLRGDRLVLERARDRELGDLVGPEALAVDLVRDRDLRQVVPRQRGESSGEVALEDLL